MSADDGGGDRQEPVVYIMVRLYGPGKWFKYREIHLWDMLFVVGKRMTS